MDMSRRGFFTSIAALAAASSVEPGPVVRAIFAPEPNNRIWNVKDFGAFGDGVTDDSVAIAMTFEAAGERGTVYFPPGTYRWSRLG